MKVSVEKQTEWVFGFVWYFLTPLIVVLTVGAIALAIVQSPENNIRNSITCYNNTFEITYMSPPSEVIGSTPNQYGVWTLEKGTYIQNSGETCVVEGAHVSDK